MTTSTFNLRTLDPLKLKEHLKHSNRWITELNGLRVQTVLEDEILKCSSGLSKLSLGEYYYSPVVSRRQIKVFRFINGIIDGALAGTNLRFLHGARAVGTLYHEFCHAIQDVHPNADSFHLFLKWKPVFGKSYAGERWYEAEAEVFRVLWGFYTVNRETPPAWESNEVLIKEYEEYFLKAYGKGFLP